ncbi:microtubule-associated protein futsch [Lingula anatina]|uniref:Microtubule-associated protein futsch n=1 Tax=Lingula anatina TaxID=7574 RepID=A0A1S3HK58_LINAN|nr:microtubule-associated protein futsch [Lingula anatina]|eukprot:XP_013386503.1 microtubule-associated protein futsch [Lingula anatina]
MAAASAAVEMALDEDATSATEDMYMVEVTPIYSDGEDDQQQLMTSDKEPVSLENRVHPFTATTLEKGISQITKPNIGVRGVHPGVTETNKITEEDNTDIPEMSSESPSIETPQRPTLTLLHPTSDTSNLSDTSTSPSQSLPATSPSTDDTMSLLSLAARMFDFESFEYGLMFRSLSHEGLEKDGTTTATREKETSGRGNAHRRLSLQSGVLRELSVEREISREDKAIPKAEETRTCTKADQNKDHRHKEPPTDSTDESAHLTSETNLLYSSQSDDTTSTQKVYFKNRETSLDTSQSKRATQEVQLQTGSSLLDLSQEDSTTQTCKEFVKEDTSQTEASETHSFSTQTSRAPTPVADSTQTAVLQMDISTQAEETELMNKVDLDMTSHSSHMQTSRGSSPVADFIPVKTLQGVMCTQTEEADSSNEGGSHQVINCSFSTQTSRGSSPLPDITSKVSQTSMSTQTDESDSSKEEIQREFIRSHSFSTQTSRASSPVSENTAVKALQNVMSTQTDGSDTLDEASQRGLLTHHASSTQTSRTSSPLLDTTPARYSPPLSNQASEVTSHSMSTQTSRASSPIDETRPALVHMSTQAGDRDSNESQSDKRTTNNFSTQTSREPSPVEERRPSQSDMRLAQIHISNEADDSDASKDQTPERTTNNFSTQTSREPFPVEEMRPSQSDMSTQADDSDSNKKQKPKKSVHSFSTQTSREPSPVNEVQPASSDVSAQAGDRVSCQKETTNSFNTQTSKNSPPMDELAPFQTVNSTHANQNDSGEEAETSGRSSPVNEIPSVEQGETEIGVAAKGMLEGVHIPQINKGGDKSSQDQPVYREERENAEYGREIKSDTASESPQPAGHVDLANNTFANQEDSEVSIPDQLLSHDTQGSKSRKPESSVKYPDNSEFSPNASSQDLEGGQTLQHSSKRHTPDQSIEVPSPITPRGRSASLPSNITDLSSSLLFQQSAPSKTSISSSEERLYLSNDEMFGDSSGNIIESMRTGRVSNEDKTQRKTRQQRSQGFQTDSSWHSTFSTIERDIPRGWGSFASQTSQSIESLLIRPRSTADVSLQTRPLFSIGSQTTRSLWSLFDLNTEEETPFNRTNSFGMQTGDSLMSLLTGQSRVSSAADLNEASSFMVSEGLQTTDSLWSLLSSQSDLDMAATTTAVATDEHSFETEHQSEPPSLSTPSTAPRRPSAGTVEVEMPQYTITPPDIEALRKEHALMMALLRRTGESRSTSRRKWMSPTPTMPDLNDTIQQKSPMEPIVSMPVDLSSVVTTAMQTTSLTLPTIVISGSQIKDFNIGLPMVVTSTSSILSQNAELTSHETSDELTRTSDESHSERSDTTQVKHLTTGDSYFTVNTSNRGLGGVDISGVVDEEDGREYCDVETTSTPSPAAQLPIQRSTLVNTATSAIGPDTTTADVLTSTSYGGFVSEKEMDNSKESESNTTVSVSESTSDRISFLSEGTQADTSLNITDDFTQTDLDLSLSPRDHLDESIGTDDQERHQQILDEMEKLRTERLRIISLLALDYVPSRIYVELAEAQLNYAFGQTDILLKTLEENWDDDRPLEMFKFETGAQHLTEITEEYLEKYRTQLEESKKSIEKRIRHLEKERHKGRKPRALVRSEMAKIRRQAEIEVFKVEREREQKSYESTKSPSPARRDHGTDHEHHEHGRDHSWDKGDTVSETSSQRPPSSSRKSSITSSIKMSESGGYWTPMHYLQHLAKLRKDLVKTNKETTTSTPSSTATSVNVANNSLAASLEISPSSMSRSRSRSRSPREETVSYASGQYSTNLNPDANQNKSTTPRPYPADDASSGPSAKSTSRLLYHREPPRKLSPEHPENVHLHECHNNNNYRLHHLEPERDYGITRPPLPSLPSTESSVTLPFYSSPSVSSHSVGSYRSYTVKDSEDTTAYRPKDTFRKDVVGDVLSPKVARRNLPTSDQASVLTFVRSLHDETESLLLETQQMRRQSRAEIEKAHESLKKSPREKYSVPRPKASSDSSSWSARPEPRASSSSYFSYDRNDYYDDELNKERREREIDDEIEAMRKKYHLDTPGLHHSESQEFTGYHGDDGREQSWDASYHSPSSLNYRNEPTYNTDFDYPAYEIAPSQSPYRSPSPSRNTSYLSSGYARDILLRSERTVEAALTSRQRTRTETSGLGTLEWEVPELNTIPFEPLSATAIMSRIEQRKRERKNSHQYKRK